MPKIRHLAIMCMDPQKLAKFYCDVFDMKVVTTTDKRDVFVTDGYITLALLRQKAVGKPPDSTISASTSRTRRSLPSGLRNGTSSVPRSVRPTGPMPKRAPPIRRATTSTWPKAASIAT